MCRQIRDRGKEPFRCTPNLGTGTFLRRRMKQKRIYLDNAATTPLDNRVLKAMLPFLHEDFGNASSLHSEGNRAKEALEEARKTISECLGAKPADLYFTSSGTEANNLALKGVAFAIV